MKTRLRLDPSDRPFPLRTLVAVAWMASGLMVALLSTVSPADADPMQRPAFTESGWSVEHVLFAGSRSSRTVAEALLAHPADPRARERILWVGAVPSDVPARAAALGYDFEAIRADDQRAHAAGPLLRIASPDLRVVYQGGYAARPRGPVFDDRRILNAVIAGEFVRPHPSRPG